MRRLTSILVFALAACGGKVEADPSEETSSVPSSSEAEEATPTWEAEDGEWGTWQLLSVEGSDGKRQYDPPFVELDLHPDGVAYMWTCIEGTTGTGKRCPFYARMNCSRGTIELSGQVWRVHFPSEDGRRTQALGDIVDEPSGDITVKGEGALHPRGHYRRVGAASPDGCLH